ncbi:alpha/beta hydrolase [Zeaxanthinibacter enoshimensis]|uniref:Acetyl esterase/lipase n=1 Tax=Zeaxanthinibacter enoshimensis TaxID=392009 RepID=A0A4R6TLG1_9FLAO|nr:alpha/beta hydrolase [Zeaxanthinibacter enoshimensis]TDQ32194.1 acetyl esterase/lipase [Zeaxanthinibacter enoshimensis]
MKYKLILLLTCMLILSSCAKKLVSVPLKTSQQVDATYKVLKDIPYGPDKEQNMDIYLSEDANSYGDKNYTIVFLHGGAYYLSDKTQEEKYIRPYLQKGLNVVNMNYRLKRGIAPATSDLTNALNFLKENNSNYDLDLGDLIVTGFSAGAQIATNTGLARNNASFPDTLKEGITIKGIINFSGPVDDLDVIERIFVDFDHELFSQAGKALFPSEGYEKKEVVSVYEPITYFDVNDPPVFLWHGGKDNQVPPETFRDFTSKLRRNRDVLSFIPEGKHSPTEEELSAAYIKIFQFLDDL